jgi:hypothetical protein
MGKASTQMSVPAYPQAISWRDCNNSPVLKMGNEQMVLAPAVQPLEMKV